MKVTMMPELPTVEYWNAGNKDHAVKVSHIWIDNKHYTYEIDYIRNITMLRNTGEMSFFDSVICKMFIPKILELNEENPTDTIEKFYSLLTIK